MPEESSNKSNDGDDTIGNLKQSSNPSKNHPEVAEKSTDKDGRESNMGSYAPPVDTLDKELNKEEVKSFLEKKGAVEILAQLADGPKRFGKIDDALVVSHGTTATRLTEGAKLGLWREYITYPDDGGKINLYEIEPEAQSLATVVQDENISETMEQRRQANERHANALSNFRDRVWTNDSHK